ncbi:MAG TPA: XRE family transcriptional regulator [Sulfurovum sp.]|nr:XRE family transcriptional regulator [Sulfurovum sp.]
MRDSEEENSDFTQKIYEQIGANVKRLREERNITQLELSHAIGHKSVSVVSCAEICHKNYHFNIEHLSKIAYVLEVDICEFFKEIEL